MSYRTRSENGRRFWILLCVTLILMIFSSAAMGFVFQNYSNVLIKRQDDQLLRMAQARDRSIAADFTELQKYMDYMLKHPEVMEAETEWITNGNPEELLLCLQDNPIIQAETIHTMLAFRDGQAMICPDGRADYTFFNGFQQPFSPCRDGDGKVYLAYSQTSQSATYAALLDLELYLQKIACVTGDGEFQTMLLSENQQILMFQGMDGNFVSSLAHANEKNCDMQALSLLQESFSSQRAMQSAYTFADPDDGEQHQMRFASIPACQTQNGYFSVALSVHFDAVVRPMHIAAIQLLISSGVAAVSLFILCLLVIHLMKRNRQRTNEVKQLMEEKHEISILLEKSQQLAHHQRLETIGTLTSGIAHEFNNLLTPIMSYSVMALEKLPEELEEIGENIARIYDASTKAKTLVARLSKLSQKDAALPIHVLPLDESIRKSAEIAATACPINVRIDLQLDCADACIKGNETQMSQLLLNLFINAFNAMKENGGQLSVSSRAEADVLTVMVEDNGCGIAPDVLPHIFEPFFTTRSFENGTGLGLAIVQQVVESLRGSVEVVSEEGEGTCFTLRFPRCEPPVKTEEEDETER